jgi:hypothetical protein
MLFETYRAKSSLSAAVFAADDWKDVPQRLKPSSGEWDAARLNPCPSLINATRKNLLSFRQQPINETNLILFGQALLKAINTLHRQKTSCSANLDSYGCK